MTNDIQLNLNTDLKFKVVPYENAGTVRRVRYSASGKRFVDIEQTTDLGFVTVETLDAAEHVATINGERVHGELTFAAEELEVPTGTRVLLWNVYNFDEKTEDDIDLAEVGSSDIPAPIIDMLL